MREMGKIWLSTYWGVTALILRHSNLILRHSSLILRHSNLTLRHSNLICRSKKGIQFDCQVKVVFKICYPSQNRIRKKGTFPDEGAPGFESILNIKWNSTKSFI
jgi:hypothetical protein